MEDKPNLKTSLWQGFTLDHNEDDAARIFHQRYGRMPEYIVEDHGQLWVGPIPVPAAPINLRGAPA